MSKIKSILIVEDERLPAEFLKNFLEVNSYKVVGICSRGTEAIEKAIKLKPDLIFMDIMLKDHISGSDAALQISSRIQTKIIFLTAYSDKEMIDSALEAGAVNYLTKPYQDSQILAALKLADSQIPYNESEPDTQIQLPCGYHYDFELQRLYKGDKETDIGVKSLRLIAYLCRHINKTVSPEQLSTYIYGEEKDSSTLRTLIFRLKKNLNCNLIQNISGIGYKITGKE